MSIKYLIIGNGFIGNRFAEYLGNESIVWKDKITSVNDIVKAIELHNPEIVINCAGKTGKPNVDACEDEPELTFFGNVTVPGMIAEACNKKGKKMVHLGTGCTYEGSNNFTEDDEPNFKGSLYSRTKLICEKMLKNYDNVLQIRIRIPLDDRPSDRNLVDKLLKYAKTGGKILIAENSITPLSFLFYASKELMNMGKTGLYNVVAKGSMTHDMVLDIYQELTGEKLNYQKINAKELDLITKAKRSNCTLSTAKLEATGIKVPDVKDSIKECLTKYVEHRRNKSILLNNGKKIKGIILAGGAGSRLYPLTKIITKQLQPVYDKPMIYYPLTTLIENGISEFCIICTPQDLPAFKKLLGDGSQFGVKIEYREQIVPNGIAQAFVIAESFIGNDSVALILGDNVFYGGSDVISKAFSEFNSGGAVFGYQVNDPERYGVVEFDLNGKALSIEEKPKQPKSNYAVPGLYIFDSSVIEIARNMKPSARGEYEITDVNVAYLNLGKLKVYKLQRGFAWLDAGTSSSLHDASAYIQTIEKRQGIKVGCPEEASYNRGFITLKQLKEVIDALPNCEYKQYLATLVK